MIKKLLVFSLVLLFFVENLVAQCPMCKQSLVSARADGDTTVGSTLNNGIIYLFVFPYILAGVFLFIYIRNVRMKNKLAQQANK